MRPLRSLLPSGCALLTHRSCAQEIPLRMVQRGAPAAPADFLGDLPGSAPGESDAVRAGPPLQRRHALGGPKIQAVPTPPRVWLLPWQHARRAAGGSAHSSHAKRDLPPVGHPPGKR